MSAEALVPCSVGAALNSDHCHRLTHCRKTGYIRLNNLSENDKKLLEWRCGKNFTNEDDNICYHHEKLYISSYVRLQKYCCDPLKVHKKKLASKYYNLIIKIMLKSTIVK